MDKILKIADKVVGDNQPVFIIAEIGLNHNGKLELAKKMIKAAKESGADAVKFQKRDLKSLYKKDIYENPNKDSQSTSYLFKIFKKFELSKKDFIELKKYCEHLGIIFFCTPFDIKSAEFLSYLDVSVYKISSADLTNIPLIDFIISKKKPLILSTGMSQIPEIDFTYKFLKKKKADFSFMHCVSTYPTAFKDVNLTMIPFLKEKYQVPIGYSGHERGIIIAIGATTLGAKIIEKHFTLNRSWDGPDHNISLTPSGFKKMVDRIRVIESALGTTDKNLSRGEYLTREVFAKSLIARKQIKKGEIITYEMIDIRGPGKGLNPQMIEKIIGKKAKRDFKKYDFFYQLDI